MKQNYQNSLFRKKLNGGGNLWSRFQNLLLLVLCLVCSTNVMAADVKDLASITGNYEYTPTAALTTSTLYDNDRILSLGGSGYSVKGDVTVDGKNYTPCLQIKNSRQIAMKIACKATVTVIGSSNSSRAWQIGTTSAGKEIADGGNSSTTASGEVDGSTTPVVIYINATSDLYLAKIIVKESADAAPTVSIPAQLNAYAGENASITATISAKPDATSIKWYSCNADKSNASVKQDDAAKTTFGFKPSATGTRYYYCEVTNSVGTTESDVCEVTVVDRPSEYTFGTTRTLGGTTFANANTKVDPSADGVTVSDILSTYGTLNGQTVYHGSADAYTSDGAYRNATAVGNTTIKTQAGDADGAENLGAYLGFKLSVAPGKMISITNIASDMYVGNKSNWYYEYVIENSNGTQIYKSPAPIRIASYNSGSGFSSSVPLNENALKNLTGDVTVKLIWWINSGGTSMVFKDFNVTATVEDAPAVYYNIAYSKGDSDAEGTLPTDISDASTLLQYAVPANSTLYKAGYTLTGWTDGEKTYNVGESYDMAEGTHNLTPVFTANTEALNEFKKATDVIWYFGKSNGAPTYDGTANAQVKQVKVNATTVDLGAVMAGGDNSGRNDEWMNAQQKDITVPVCNGAVIETKVYYANDAVINGEIQTYDAEKNGPVGNVKYTYTYTGEDNSVAVNVGNQFISYIKVTYPGSSNPWVNFEDVAIDFSNGAYITSSETSVTTIGVKKENGNVVRTTTEDAEAIATVAGKFHSNDHGLQNFTMTIAVPGNVKISAGTCQWGGNLYVKKGGVTVATVNTNNGTCFHGDKTKNKVIAYYEGEATTLTIEGGSYMPFISVERVDDVPALRTVKFYNGADLVNTTNVYDGTGVGTLPAAPAVADGKRFRGWYTATDGTGIKATSATVVNADMNLYAFIMDKPELVNGYYIIPNNASGRMNGEALLNAIEMANDMNGGVKLFLKNGTYDFGSLVKTPVKQNVSLIGQSMGGVKIVNHPAEGGMNNSETLYLEGDGTYVQDLAIRCDCSYPDSPVQGKVGVAVQVRGDKVIFKNVDLQGNQDTYLSSGSETQRGYFVDGRIEGTVDYICGGGNMWFENTLLYNNKRSNADVIVAPNTNANTTYGYVFNNCTVDGDAGQAGKWNLARGWNNSPAATFINTTCKIAPSTKGYTTMTDNLKCRFHEYGTKNAEGTAITGHTLDGLGYSNLSDAIYIDYVFVEETWTYNNVVKGSDNWDAAAIASQKTVSNVALNGTTLSWEGDAAAYLIEKNGEFVAIVTEETATVDANAEYTVRAANARGGFGEGAQNAVVTLTYDIAVGTGAKEISSTQETTDDSIVMTGISAKASDAAGKANLTVKIDASQAATVGFTVPAGYEFVPYSVSVPVQPVSTNSQVTIALGDLSKTFSNTQGVITTNVLENTESKTFTGDVTLSITIKSGCTTYRLGTPITIKGVLVELPSSVSATVSAAGMATFCSPYNLDFSETTIKAYKGVLEGEVLKLVKKDKVAAGEGVLLYVEGGTTEDIPTTTENVEEATDNAFVGTLVDIATLPTDGGDVTNYILNNGSAGLGFYRANNKKVGAGKSYLQIPAAQGAKVNISFVFAEDEATAADVIESETVKVMPVKFFKNNQLIIMKNGKQYNAAGAEK